MQNRGQFKEDQMLVFLNNKKFKELSPNLHNMVEALFGVVDPDEMVYCEHGIERTKPDIVITIGQRKKYVSMKTGSAKAIHSEQIDSFITFLKSIGVSQETIETVLLYHYGDGTTNGTGKERRPTEQLACWLGKRLEEANDELNSDEFVWSIINHVAFQGVNPNVPAADAIYFGDVEYGVIATVKQFKKRFARSDGRWRFFHNLHVGPIFIKPAARYAGTEIKEEERRHKVICEWFRLREDIEYISKRYDNYTPLRFRTYEE